MKKLILTFAVLGVSLAAAKSYSLTIGDKVQAGTVELQPGEYTLVLEQSKVRFTEVNTGKTFEAAVTVEDAAKKFSSTAINSHDANGVTKVDEIDLAGTTKKIEFK
jgi:hypothetical protein